MTSEGSQLTLRFMSKGHIIGCAAVFRGIPYPATATVVEDTGRLCWTSTQIKDLVRRYPQLASNALAIVGGRADEFLQRLREATTERVEQRIARALLRTASAQGKLGERIAVSRQELAEIASTSLNTVSRTVSAWDRQGIVTADEATSPFGTGSGSRRSRARPNKDFAICVSAKTRERRAAKNICHESASGLGLTRLSEIPSLNGRSGSDQ